jgi:hypothetical protein
MKAAVAALKAALAPLALGGLFFLSSLSGCAHDLLYVPVGPGASGGPAMRYPIPPTAPQGEAYVTSFGFTDIDLGPGAPNMLLHARLAVSNGSPGVWTVDGRMQAVTYAGRQPVGPSFLNTDAGVGPVYLVPQGQVRVFDLYYALPAPFDQPMNLGGFSFECLVIAGGQIIPGRTSFQRFEGAAGSYEPYPPYVAVGLGFGFGWWYGPFFPYNRVYPPVFRHYYYPPARGPGGPWHGRPMMSGSLRGAPPPGGGGWRGSPPAAGGLRGSPPTSPAPAPHFSSPGGGRGFRGGGGHGHR